MGFIKDGVDLRDFEKLITGIAFFLSVLAVCFMYVIYKYVDGTMCLFSSSLGTLFVVRKMAKYNLQKGTFDMEESKEEREQ